MWARYDTTGRQGQRVAWAASLQRWNGSTWVHEQGRKLEYGFARNQRPRGSDPGNLVTYQYGGLIYTGAERGNDPFGWEVLTTAWWPKYYATYRVVVTMVWYPNRYWRNRGESHGRWTLMGVVPLETVHTELVSQHCVVEQ